MRPLRDRWRTGCLRSQAALARFPSLSTLAFASCCCRLAPLRRRNQNPFQESERTRYQIQLKLDFDGLSYTGSERVRWVNRGERPSAVLYFHLYSNLRPTSRRPPSPPARSPPKPKSRASRSPKCAPPPTTRRSPIQSTIREQPCASICANQWRPGRSTEVVVGFKGNVPEVDPDETGLTTHVVKQVSAALRGDREIRRPRDMNFRCRGVMLLGTFLSGARGARWRRVAAQSSSPALAI